MNNRIRIVETRNQAEISKGSLSKAQALTWHIKWCRKYIAGSYLQWEHTLHTQQYSLQSLLLYPSSLYIAVQSAIPIPFTQAAFWTISLQHSPKRCKKKPSQIIPFCIDYGKTGERPQQRVHAYSHWSNPAARSPVQLREAAVLEHRGRGGSEDMN